MALLKQFVWQVIFFIVSLLGPHKVRLSKNNLLVLTYHRVLPEYDQRIAYEQPGMYVTSKTFELHLKILKKYFELVSLEEWLKKVQLKQPLPTRACVVTFDDGWQDNYEYAYPLLKKYQVPATIFVVSNFIGSEKDFWPGRLAQLVNVLAENKVDSSTNFLHWLKIEQLSYSFNHIQPTPEELDEIIAYSKQYSDAENHQYIDDAWSQLVKKYPILKETPYRATVNQKELEEMVNSGLIDIGSHTCNHIRLEDSLDESVLKLEIGESKNILTEKFNHPVELFCYPNGDYSELALKEVVKIYKGACTTQRGWNNPKSNTHLLKRISIHDSMTKTTNGFLTKISGWI